MYVKQQRPSQSLLEAILAISVILISVFAAATLLITTITAGQTSRDKIVASNLAREGLEVVRGIRDSNWMKRSMNETCGGNIYNWDTLSDCTSLTPNSYVPVFDSVNLTWSLSRCSEPACTTGNIKAVSKHVDNFYTNACATCAATKYSRTIIVTTPNDSFFGTNVAYLNVVTTITWNNHGPKSLSLTERFYDWR